jgi:hypothetical protein
MDCIRALSLASALIVTSGLGALAQTGTGLTGKYYDDMSFTAAVTTRTDPAVHFNFGTAIPPGTAITAATTYSVAWSGQIEAGYSELYTFFLTADDGARLWVDDELIVQRTFYQSTTEMRGQRRMKAGHRVNVRVEFLQNAGSASVKLEWASASQARQVVPTARLYPTTATPNGGSVMREVWHGLAGASIATLTSATNYPSKPASREFLTSFECLAKDWEDSFGTRVTGFIRAPVSGSYTFAVSGDEVVQLYLSTDTNPANKSLIASTTTATAFRDFAANSSQQSAARNLVAGQQYDVELLHKEETGADHGSVGWMKPGDAAFSIIPGPVLMMPGTDRATLFRTLPGSTQPPALAGTVISDASLDLSLAAAGGGTAIGTLDRHRLLTSFVEGTGDGIGTTNGTGTGADWLRRTYIPSTAWSVAGTAAGSDYAATPLSSMADFDPTGTEAGTTFTFDSTAGFVAAVADAVSTAQPLYLLAKATGDHVTSGNFARLASDDHATTEWRPQLTIGYHDHLAPIIDRGAAPAAVVGTAANVNGTVTHGTALGWSYVSGPGPVFFLTSNATGATILFPRPGAHLLRLNATNAHGEGSRELLVNVTGTAMSELQIWRQTYFATFANSGTAADLADGNKDGEANLLEFATGQYPNAATRAAIGLVKNGVNLEFTYTRTCRAGRRGNVHHRVERHPRRRLVEQRRCVESDPQRQWHCADGAGFDPRWSRPPLHSSQSFPAVNQPALPRIQRRN